MGNIDMPSSKRQAEAALSQMRSSLRGWMRIRKRMDDYVAGKVRPPALFRRTKPLPPTAVAATLRSDRYNGEQDLADTLHALLVESGVPTSALPSTDVAKDPDAAVKLAKIVVSGKYPAAVSTPAETGIIWFVLAIPVLGAVLVISQLIKSRADVEKEKERLRCIQAGACTDSGFWLKTGSIVVASWVAWDKLGLREVVAKYKKKL